MSDPCDTREEAEAELDVVATYDRLSTGPVPSGEWVVEELEEGS